MASWPWSIVRTGWKKRRAVHQRKRQRLRRRVEPIQCLAELLEKRAMMAVVVPAYDVIRDLGNEFEASIRLHNHGSEAVEDWAVSFEYDAVISSIWGATIIGREGNRYSIANEGWNSNLEVGRSILFGFIGSTDTPVAELNSPANYAVNGELLEGDGEISANSSIELIDVASGSYEATFIKVNEWDAGFIGEVVIQNKSEHTLAGWEVEFDFAGEIEAAWKGSVVARSGSRYTVRGEMQNPDVSPGGAVSFQFHGKPDESESWSLFNLRVSGICDGPQPLEQSTQPAVLQSPSPRLEPVPDAIDGAGKVFTLHSTHVDIVDFDSTQDRLHFGASSSHGLTLAKTISGEPAVVNLWADTLESQIISGVQFDELSTENFSFVANEHLRQDIGGALSWELGIGPRDSDTVYIRSHEVGVHERIQGFDPAKTSLSFLYFSSRARLSIDDTAEGILISAKGTGQSVLLVGVSKSQLLPHNIEFHHDQIVESQLQKQFGFIAEEVRMVSRSELLTPVAPTGTETDGHQVRYGSGDLRNGYDSDIYSVVASTTEYMILADGKGLAYISWFGAEPIPITRADNYWQGHVPVSREGASLMAAARDDLGRLRVLDGTGTNVYAWILDANGSYVSEEGPADTSIGTKERLFRYDIDEDGGLDPIAGVNSGNDGDEHWGEAYFAPYVDMAFWSAPNLTEIAATRGTSLLTLAFVLATADGKTAWGGVDSLALDSQSERSLAIDQSIASFQAAGGNVMVSFGGAADNSLAYAYAVQGKTPHDLADAYLQVIDRYALNRVDFDIEGTAISDPASIALRSNALSLLQQARPDVEIWYTLPALPSGLTYNGMNVVRSALQAGVVLDGVNIMAMNYGEWAAPTSGPDSQTLGYYATTAAQGTHNQLTPLYREFGHVFDWNQVGVTPMIGVNDLTYEVFTLDDAQELENFAREKDLGMLSMWSVARDNPGSYGQASATASGLDLPAGSFSSVFRDYGTQNLGISYTEVAATTDVRVLVDFLGFVYLSDSGGAPIAVTRSDSYWQGSIPLSRNGATVMAAARDEFGRLRVLDGSESEVYAWILDENGHYIGEEGPGDTSLHVKELLFQFDIDGDGFIGALSLE